MYVCLFYTSVLHTPLIRELMAGETHRQETCNTERQQEHVNMLGVSGLMRSSQEDSPERMRAKPGTTQLQIGSGWFV